MRFSALARSLVKESSLRKVTLMWQCVHQTLYHSRKANLVRPSSTLHFDFLKGTVVGFLPGRVRIGRAAGGKKNVVRRKSVEH